MRSVTQQKDTDTHPVCTFIFNYYLPNLFWGRESLQVTLLYIYQWVIGWPLFSFNATISGQCDHDTLHPSYLSQTNVNAKHGDFKDRTSHKQTHRTCSSTSPRLLQCFLFGFLNRVWRMDENLCHFYAKMRFIKAFLPLVDVRMRWESSSIQKISCLTHMFNTHSIIYSTDAADLCMFQLSSADRNLLTKKQETFFRC